MMMIMIMAKSVDDLDDHRHHPSLVVQKYHTNALAGWLLHWSH
jgi:hypothetical protein